MTKTQILDAIKSLACSQGWYGSILKTIESDPEKGEEFLEYLSQQNLKDTVDLVLFLES